MAPLSMTVSDLWPGFQGHDIFQSQISEILTVQILTHRLTYKVTVAQEEKYLTYYGMVLW